MHILTDRYDPCDLRFAEGGLHTVAARIGPVPASVALSLRRRAREVPVDAEESDHYPAGGFDAISTRGSFENLVRTEVAYVGEGCAEPGGVDLFDVRFVEGELLFYTRDESPLLSLALSAEMAHRRVELAIVDDWSAVPDAGRVVFSLAAAEPGPRLVAWVRVGGDAWTSDEGAFDLREGPSALRALADALLLAIARGASR
jgi:hypothetical protein